MIAFLARMVLPIALLGSSVLGFGVTNTPVRLLTIRTVGAIPNSKSRLFGIRCANKYYQLEELEDKDTCTTELFLKADRTIEFGETDGPIWTAAVGTWDVTPNTNDYKMTITRTFVTGSEGREMGEFTYDLVRRFEGDMSMVGESVAIGGLVYAKVNDDGDEIPAGYFNMIDATVERQGDDKKVA